MLHLTETGLAGDNVPAGPVEEQHNTNNGFQDQTLPGYQQGQLRMSGSIQLTGCWRHSHHPCVSDPGSRNANTLQMYTRYWKYPALGVLDPGTPFTVALTYSIYVNICLDFFFFFDVANRPRN